LFEAVQKVLQTKERPRKRKIKHDFPFTGLFRCGECGYDFRTVGYWKIWWSLSVLSVLEKARPLFASVFARKELRGKSVHGFKQFRFAIAIQDWMLDKVKMWEREEIGAPQSEVQNLSDRIKANEERMEKLVTAYLDGDVPKKYISNEKMFHALSRRFETKKKDFERGRNNWVEPLREWILDTKQANFLSSSSDLYQIKSFVQKIGTNPLVRDKSAQFAVPVPSQFVAKRRALLPTPAPKARASSHLSDSEVSFGRASIV
jgi:hypothetical protein